MEIAGVEIAGVEIAGVEIAGVEIAGVEIAPVEIAAPATEATWPDITPVENGRDLARAGSLFRLRWDQDCRGRNG